MIRVGIIGVGNCAKSLVEGVALYRSSGKTDGLMFPKIGGYTANDIEFALGVDVDERKVDQPLSSAIYSLPNCAKSIIFTDQDHLYLQRIASCRVVRGPVLDGVAPHMRTDDPTSQEKFFLDVTKGVSFGLSKETLKNSMIGLFKQEKLDVALIYLPVGSKEATRFYVDCLLEAKIPFVNCIPEFIVSDPKYWPLLEKAGIPAIGDDMRSQVGASVLSQCLQEMLLSRGAKVKFHCQTNIGGNTDFFNMLDIHRTESKKESKENVIVSQNELRGIERVEHAVHAGPSDYVRYLKDTKVAHIRIEGTGFGGFPFELDCKLKVEDSPNSAGVVIDAIRYLATARDQGFVGPLYGPSAFTQKTPPRQLTFSEAYNSCLEYAQYKS